MPKRSLVRNGLIATVVGLPIAAFGLRVYVQIHDGHGAETYQNLYGWNVPWTVPATMACALVLAAAGALSIRWWYIWKRARSEGVPMKQISKEIGRDS